MHPKLLTTPFFTIYTYGLMLALAYLSALWLLLHGARTEGINRDKISKLGIWVIVGAIVGAKALMILRDPSNVWSFSTLQSGGDFYGGFIGALVATAVFFARNRDMPGWRIADLCGPAIALGQAIGRVGCFMAGCCYGKSTELWWGVTFTDPVANEIVGTPLGKPLHPVQLYESFFCLVIFTFLLWKLRRKRFEGQIILLYALLYALMRFLIEFLRGDVDRGFLFNGLLSTSQFVALIVIAVGLPAYFLRRKTSAIKK